MSGIAGAVAVTGIVAVPEVPVALAVAAADGALAGAPAARVAERHAVTLSPPNFFQQDRAFQRARRVHGTHGCLYDDNEEMSWLRSRQQW